MPPTKTSLAEKLLAFAIAAAYVAALGYVVVGVTRRASAEVRALRAQKKPAAPLLLGMMRRLLK